MLTKFVSRKGQERDKKMFLDYDTLSYLWSSASILSIVFYQYFLFSINIFYQFLINIFYYYLH